MNMSTLPELLAPAGSFDAALAAFQYGADAIYLGMPRFSARADADNITPERLRTLLAYARTFTPRKKTYVTFNTLIQDNELPQAIAALDELADLAPDGVIVQDLGVARLIREHFPSLPLHASTQLAAHNLDGVLALKALGFCRVVLARELTLAEIETIVRESGVEIEIFIHGALCYSVSGLCLFSSHITGRSGNRGRCAYCCRDTFTPESSAPAHIFSMRDLALAPVLSDIAATGVHSLKIEGRMKSPLYVACVTDFYRRKLDNTLPDEPTLIQDLQTIFSRPWTTLYANRELGVRNEELGMESDKPRHPASSIPHSSFLTPNFPVDPSAVGHRGARIGQTEAVTRDRSGTRWLRFTTNRALEKHDGLQIELPGSGKPFGFSVNLLRPAGSPRTVISMPAGTTVEVALPVDDTTRIPPHAPVFCSASQAVRRRYELHSIRESELPIGRPVIFRVALRSDGIAAQAQAADTRADAFIPLTLTPSRQPEQTAAAVRKAFERLGDTAWRFAEITLDDPDALYAPPSKLNETRRAVLEKLSHAWATARAEHITGIRLPSERPPLSVAPAFTVKLRASTPAIALTGIDACVLAIGHTPFEQLEPQLAAWSSAFPVPDITLALPLFSRDYERPLLRTTLRQLIDADWTRWECADLAGLRLLSEFGVTPVSSDWSLYALNRVALAELASLGIQRAVLSPESSRANLRALCTTDVIPAVEVIIYQHTPLFISETAPALHAPTSAPRRIIDRRGRAFTVQRLDSRWITIADSPFYIPDTDAQHKRIDLSWSPDAAWNIETLAAIRAGHTIPGTHTANFARGFV